MTPRLRRPWWVCALGAGAILLGGCATDQQKDVEKYRAITDLEPQPVFARGDRLSLADAVRLANAYNEQLGIRGERYLQTLIERRRRVANLLPTLSLFGDLALRENTGSNRIAAFDGGFNAQYTFLTGLSDLRRIDAVDADIRTERWLLLDLREALLLDTARAYYTVLRSERLVEVLESSSRVQEERLRDIRGRQQVGFARPLDVAQIESQASQTKVSLLDAQNAVSRGRSALALLTGVEAETSPLTDGMEAGADPAPLATLLADGYVRRQDLLAARAAADSARFTVDAAMGQYAPSIQINLDYFLVRDITSSDLDFSALVSIHLPIFSAGRIEADVQQAWSVFRQRVLEYSALKRQVRSDVETALIDVHTSRQRVVELAVQVGSAAEALRQAEAAYGAGLGTNLERVAAQDQLLAAQLRQATEEFTLKVAYLALSRAGGGLTENLTESPAAWPDPAETVAPESPFVRLPPAAGGVTEPWMAPIPLGSAVPPASSAPLDPR